MGLWRNGADGSLPGPYEACEPSGVLVRRQRAGGRSRVVVRRRAQARTVHDRRPGDRGPEAGAE